MAVKVPMEERDLKLVSEPTEIEFQEQDGEDKLPSFSMVAYTGRVMEVSAWFNPVVVDLEGMTIDSQTLPVRFHHDSRSGVGHTTAVEVRKNQLYAEGLISRETPEARDVRLSGKRGFPWQVSIGARALEIEFIDEKTKLTVNGRKVKGPVDIVRKSVLNEVSFVDRGADTKTKAKVAASHSEDEETAMGKMKNKKLEEEADVNADAADDSSDDDTKETKTTKPKKVKAAAEDKKETAPSKPVVPDVTASDDSEDPMVKYREVQAAETERITSIRKHCGGENPEIEAKAIRENWSSDKTELALLRASRPKAPAVNVPDNNVSTQVLEAACLMAGKYPTDKLEASADQKALDIADKKFKGSIGLQELLLEAAWANGYTGRKFRDTRDVLAHAFGRGRNIQAASSFSSIDISSILSNVANKFLLQGFFSVEQVWRRVTSIRPVNDFKTVTSYRLIGKDQYEMVNPGGEIKHGTLGEESYTNKADTYGLLLTIDRTDIINDDLGAISSVPRKLGRGSGLKINDVFWTAFMDNSTFFASGNSNYISGAATVLAIAGLTTGEQTFMDLVDGDGKPTGIMPRFLLVPTALSAIASQLFASLELRSDDGSTGMYPVSNPHASKYTPLVSRYLGNSSYTGYSATAWYLLADPADLPVIETVFLNGQESPTIESTDADFNVLGISMRGYHDFGVSKQDTRAGVMSKGAA